MTDFWSANLAALARRPEPCCRSLVAILTALGPAPDDGLRNRSGQRVAGWPTPVGPRALASTFDAAREAERWAGDLPAGTLVLWGAAGPDLAAALRGRGVRLQLWVDPRPLVWQSVFTCDDWRAWLEDGCWLPVAQPPEEWKTLFLDRYHPLWDGALRARDWRAATQNEAPLWEPYERSLRAALEAVTSDASSQARFAERWYRNTLANLRRLKAVELAPVGGARVFVAGAGPGLDDALRSPEVRRRLARRQETGDRLFATDTALPALAAQGLVPDLAFCLDGQWASYLHFVSQPPAIPLVADLASLPLLDRRGMTVVRYLSGHPMGTVIRRFFPELPTLDTSMGNVSGLALQTARALGASEVEAWGADFAYRDGQAYARATYVYDVAAPRVTRLSPWETRLGALCYGAVGLQRSVDQGGRAWDTTPRLRDYRLRWEQTSGPTSRVALGHGSAQDRWGAFAQHWSDRLQHLPLPPAGTSVQAFVAAQAPLVRQDWRALWPLALALHREGIAEAELPEAVVARARTFLQD